MRFTTAASALALAAVAYAQDQTIMVGQGGLKFEPQFINVTQVNSVITFVFTAANHSVAESTLATPCEPLANGFSSGFVPISGASAVWNLTVTDVTKPIWFYCPQQAVAPAHCTAGMVGAINAQVTGADPNVFVANAMSASTIVYPSTVLSGVNAFATLAPTVTAPAGSGTGAPSGSPSSSGAGAPNPSGTNGASSIQASGFFAFLAAALGVAVL